MEEEDYESTDKLCGISAKVLSSQGYAVCLFPEQPLRQAPIIDDVVGKGEINRVEAAYKPKSDLPQYYRLYWRNRLVYVLALISCNISLNNMLFFPMNIHRYGTLFLFPYTLLTIFFGYPLHALQASMGQYSQKGSLWVWECAPFCFGLGFAMILACLIKSAYHTLLAAYSFIYFARCFLKKLPWTYCSEDIHQDSPCVPATIYFATNQTIPSQQYFYSSILHAPYHYTSQFGSLGDFNWWIFLGLLMSWALVYVVTLRSARSIGKIAIVIVIVTYFALLTLLVISFLISGSSEFLIFMKQDVTLLNIRIWSSAAIQVLLELGLCYGIPVVYGSYCRFRNTVFIDSVIFTVINYIHSLLFTYLFYGYIRSFACVFENSSWIFPDQGIALLFIIYSEGFSVLAGNQLWCGIFFLMLFFIIIGIQIGMTEAILSAIYDNFITLSTFRPWINLLICSILFALGIIFCFVSGFFNISKIHMFPTFFVVIPIVLFFTFGIIFIFGIKKYSESMQIMTENNIGPLVRLFYLILFSILFIAMISGFFLINTNVFRGEVMNDNSYVYLTWAICGFILIPIFIFALLWVLYCISQKRNVLDSSNTWKLNDEMKSNGVGQFTYKYSPSFTWDWNRYE